MGTPITCINGSGPIRNWIYTHEDGSQVELDKAYVNNQLVFTKQKNLTLPCNPSYASLNLRDFIVANTDGEWYITVTLPAGCSHPTIVTGDLTGFEVTLVISSGASLEAGTLTSEAALVINSPTTAPLKLINNGFIRGYGGTGGTGGTGAQGTTIPGDPPSTHSVYHDTGWLYERAGATNNDTFCTQGKKYWSNLHSHGQLHIHIDDPMVNSSSGAHIISRVNNAPDTSDHDNNGVPRRVIIDHHGAVFTYSRGNMRSTSCNDTNVCNHGSWTSYEDLYEVRATWTTTEAVPGTPDKIGGPGGAGGAGGTGQYYGQSALAGSPGSVGGPSTPAGGNSGYAGGTGGTGGSWGATGATGANGLGGGSAGLSGTPGGKSISGTSKLTQDSTQGTLQGSTTP